MGTLTEAVDSFCLDGDFAAVVALRHQCRAAVLRGLQLWPTAAYCDYRLALDAEGPAALTGLGELSERFMLGPLAEVLASTHSFASLAAWLPRTPDASSFAHECVVRGEDLRADETACALPNVLDLPLVLEPWEPSYAVAEYSPDRARFDPPDLPEPNVEVTLSRVEQASDPIVSDALGSLVAPWISSSNGRCEVATVHGTAEQAIGSLGPRSVRVVELNPSEALAWMAWAGASGGALGRRRGASAGRHNALWALRALTGLDEGDEVDLDELGEAAHELRWVRWNDGSPDTGWSLRLAIEDPSDGIAWVIAALDAV